jgi:hypothetical protein
VIFRTRDKSWGIAGMDYGRLKQNFQTEAYLVGSIAFPVKAAFGFHINILIQSIHLQIICIKQANCNEEAATNHYFYRKTAPGPPPFPGRTAAAN